MKNQSAVHFYPGTLPLGREQMGRCPLVQTCLNGPLSPAWQSSYSLELVLPSESSPVDPVHNYLAVPSSEFLRCPCYLAQKGLLLVC